MKLRECNKCALCSGAKQLVFGHGSKDARLALVLEAPGHDEDVIGLPVIGSAGEVLHRALVEADLSKSHWERIEGFRGQDDYWPFLKDTKYGKAYLVFQPEVYITNVLKCRPHYNKTPTWKEIGECRHYLLEELNALPNLQAVMPCGETALRALTDEKGISEYRGYPLQGRHGHLCIPTFHPSFLLHGQRKYYPVLIADLRKAGRYARQGGWYEPKTHYVEAKNTTLSTILEACCNGYALDIETVGADEESGLDPRLGRITGLAVSPAKGRAFHFDFNNPIETERAAALLKQNPDNISFQNGPFDTAFLTYAGYPCECAFDTRLAQAMLSPSLPKSLRFLNSINTDYPYYKGMRKKLLKGDLSHSDTIKYCCMDADTTLQNKEKLEAELKLEKLEKPFYEIVMPLSRIFPKIQLKGVRIDLEALERHLNPDDPDSIQSRKDKIEDLFWSYGVNLNSPVQLKELLYEKIGLPNLRNTQYKTLEKLYQRTKNAVVAAIIDYRDLSTQYKLFKGLHTRARGTERVHTKYDAAGTETGRPASSDPNLNNITLPRRNIFLPDPGYSFVQGDYSRLELRVAAALSNDPEMIADVWERNIHDEVALSIYGKGYTPAQYLEGKTITFGILYGRTARSIAVAFGITVAEAERYIDVLLRKYSRLDKWRAQTQKEAKTRGYVRTPFGRLRHLADGNVSSQAVNTPIQSGAADVCNTSIIKLWHQGFDVDSPGPMILMTVYDSIIVQAPKGTEDETIQRMKEVMERPIEELAGMSFPVDFKQSDVNWEEMG